MATLTVENLVVITKSKESHIASVPKVGEITEIRELAGINTTFESGKINAIIGPVSPSIKTFLTFIYGDCESDIKASGKILYNGVERNIEEWDLIASIVEQKSPETRFATGRHQLQFYLNLKNNRLNRKETLDDHKETLQKLSLENVLDTKIKSLSNKEKRTLSIALEIIMERKVLILDQPTSGLDIYEEFELMRYLKQVAAEKDVMVILSINPSADMILKLIDNILFITDGVTIYTGPIELFGGFLARNEIYKPKGWEITDFIRELFIIESLSESINEMKPIVYKVVKKAKENFERLQESLTAPKAVQKAKKVHLGINFSEISLLLGRVLKESLFRKTYFFWVFLYALILGSYIAKVKSDNIHFFAEENVELKCIKKYIVEGILIIPFLGYYVFNLCTASGVFKLFPTIQRDINKGHFAAISFAIAAIITELLVFLVIAIVSLVCIVVACPGYSGNVNLFLHIIAAQLLFAITLYSINAFLYATNFEPSSNELIRACIFVIITLSSIDIEFVKTTLLLKKPKDKAVENSEDRSTIFSKIAFLFLPNLQLLAVTNRKLYESNCTEISEDEKLKSAEFNAVIAKVWKELLKIPKSITSAYSDEVSPLIMMAVTATVLPIISTYIFSTARSSKKCLQP